MDQAAAAALVAPDQPQVRLVVRLGMNIPVTLTLDENGSIATVGLGRPSFDVHDCDDDDVDQNFNNNDSKEDSDDENDDDEDSDDDDALMDTEDDAGYESDNSVVFLGEVIHLD